MSAGVSHFDIPGTYDLLLNLANDLTGGQATQMVDMGVGMIMANKRYLDGLDELQRKIQLEAMALCLGVGLVAGLGYSSLDVTNVIPVHAEISHLVMLMALTYLAGIFLGRRKYQ